MEPDPLRPAYLGKNVCSINYAGKYVLYSEKRNCSKLVSALISELFGLFEGRIRLRTAIV